MLQLNWNLPAYIYINYSLRNTSTIIFSLVLTTTTGSRFHSHLYRDEKAEIQRGEVNLPIVTQQRVEPRVSKAGALIPV